MSGTSAATLTPTTLGPGFHPDGPGYVLNYTYQGHQYGGFVAQGRFQDSGFSVPAAGGPPISNNTFGPGTNANGEFTITGSTFTADVFVGTGHANAHWTATGRLTSAAAAEPVVLLLSAAGLAGAAMLRRSRRS